MAFNFNDFNFLSQIPWDILELLLDNGNER